MKLFIQYLILLIALITILHAVFNTLGITSNWPKATIGFIIGWNLERIRTWLFGTNDE